MTVTVTDQQHAFDATYDGDTLSNPKMPRK